MDRRIFGLENEYAVSCTVHKGPRQIPPDELVRYLFRGLVAFGRTTNHFMRNGSRLYLDVGAHPEYATPECDDVVELVTHDKAGERVLEGLAAEAAQRLREEGVDGAVYVFKNNTDSAGNSYGCHENYLVPRAIDFLRITDRLLPFLVTRQLICGAGKVVQTPRGTVYSLSQRAEHIWEEVSQSTTRSRPIINTRDEPHADAGRFRRLHIIVGDSNMSETTTMLKVGATDLVLRMIEVGIPLRDLTLGMPIPAIRATALDLSGTTTLRLSSGREASPLQIQQEYFDKASDFADARGIRVGAVARVLDLWGRTLEAVRTEDWSKVDSEIDWVMKHQLIEGYRIRHNLPLGHPRVAQVDLAYHDISRRRGLFYLLQNHGRAVRVSDDLRIFEAKSVPPQTTRARLRGEFIRRAQQQHRPVTVDWVHLRVNDKVSQVVCDDPFRAADVRVDELIAAL